MLKTMLKEVWDRVVRSYKSTLIGLGAGVLIVVLDQVVLQAQGSTSSWLKALAVVCTIAGAALKSKALQPAPVQPPTP